MTEAGLKKIDDAKRDGSWNRLDDVEALKLTQDFKKALISRSGYREF
jgi:uncharacterized protein YdeI (YjbR/CyaY-like superfamily)